MALLAGKVGVVFGVASHRSLAWAVAQSWRKAGAQVAVCVQSDRFVEPVRKLMASEGIGGDPIVCNATKEEDVAAAFSRVEAAHSRCDAVLHAMAYASQAAMRSPLTECTDADFLESQHVSAYTLVRLCRHAAPLMHRTAGGGSVVTLSYQGSTRVVPQYKVMGAGKASLEALARYLAVELGPQAIRVNTISPGPVDTLAARGIPGFTELRCASDARAPLRSVDTIKRDVGDLAAFLVSDSSRSITGQNIAVDCGVGLLA